MFKGLAHVSKALLVKGIAFPLLDRGLNVLNCISSSNIQGAGLAVRSFNED